jgi:hypothetical protein
MFSIIKTLYYNMQCLPIFREICFYGIRNFRGSAFFSPGNTFYLHNFILAFKSENSLKK